jgi:hypothetical protein
MQYPLAAVTEDQKISKMDKIRKKYALEIKMPHKSGRLLVILDPHTMDLIAYLC